jgi:hypothetical protein
MSVEDRVTRALHDEAGRVDVDVPRLHAATLARTSQRRRRRWTGPVVAAAALLLVVAGIAAGPRLLEAALPHLLAPVTTSKAGGVSAEFTCPRTVTVDRQGRRTDDSFLPGLRGGPAYAADQEGAPRYAYTSSGDRAVLRLGNADGTLASTATFRRDGIGWDLVSTTKCAGEDGSILVPEDNPLRLGQRAATPYPPDDMVGSGDGAVLVDDRSYYDVAGLVRHRTMWAAPCGASLCLASGKPTSMVTAQLRDGARPVAEDLSSMFLPPDDSVGRKNPYGFWVVYDPQRTYTGVAARNAEGHRTVDAVRIGGPDWSGQAFALLAPKRSVADVVVDTPDGPRVLPIG